MGLIGRLSALLFGDGRNVLKETAEVFRENAEGASVREAELRAETLAQLAAEFAAPRQGWFDRMVDGLNRLPRPALALGTLGLMAAAMVDPVWFGARMQGLALVPDPLWWLMGAIVSFYFGARFQVKGQEFQRSVAASLARVPLAVANLETLAALGPGSPGVAAAGRDAGLAIEAVAPDANPALEEWLALHGPLTGT